MSDAPRLPLARLLLVGALVPAVFSAVDHWLLNRLQVRPNDDGHLILTMAVFVVQVGLLGWLCGRLLENPWWRWGLYIWGWVLVDLQVFAAAAYSGYNWSTGGLLTSSLLAAQVGLTVIWAILGTTHWAIRLPTCAVAGILLAIPLRGGFGFANGLFPVQVVALARLCLALRWQRFRLRRIDLAPHMAGSSAARQSQPAQFGIRHVLIWTTSIALMLGVLRALDLLSLRGILPFFEGSVVALLTAGLLIACAFVVAVWAALGSGPAWLRILLLVLALAAIGLVLAALYYYSDGVRYSGFGGRALWSIRWDWRLLSFNRYGWIAVWLMLGGSLLFASLIILRVIGYRLVRMPKVAGTLRVPLSSDGTRSVHTT